MSLLFQKAFFVASVTVAVDFFFHYFLTHPMESLTYFVIKFLLAFFVAIALFESKIYRTNLSRKNVVVFVAGLVFSTLMSTYYRAWELGEAHVPFGARAPDIIGITRTNLLLFSGTWWLGHALFFAIGVWVANRLITVSKK